MSRRHQAATVDPRSQQYKAAAIRYIRQSCILHACSTAGGACAQSRRTTPSHPSRHVALRHRSCRRRELIGPADCYKQGGKRAQLSGFDSNMASPFEGANSIPQVQAEQSSESTIPAQEPVTLSSPELPQAESNDNVASESVPFELNDKQKTALLRQIEYYLCDLSFPYDEFLQSKADASGAIPVSVLADSPRVQALVPNASSEDRAVAIKAVVPESDSIELTSDGQVKRLHPLPSEDPKASTSVYLAGLPKGATEEALRELLLKSNLSDTYTPIVSIRRQRDLQRDRSFTGHIFVEVETAEKAAALVKAANKGSITCTKAKILKDYYESQAQSIKEQRERRAKGGGSGSGKGPAGGCEGGQQSSNGKKRPAPEVESGLVLRFEAPGESADREALAKACEPFGEVAYVRFSRGDKEGSVRFKSREAAEAALAGLSAVDIGGAVPTWRNLTEAEEEAYYAEYHERAQQKRQRGGGRGGGRGYGGGGRGYRGKGRGNGGN